MGLDMPEEVKWLFPFVVGESWPEGDEDELRRIAEAWRQAAEGIDAVLAEADQGARLANASMDGETAEAFAQLWAKIGERGDAALAQLRDACRQNGLACDNTALEIEHTKLTIIFSLVALLVQISIMVGAAFVSGGASTAGILPAQMLTRTAVQMVFRQLIISILRNVAIELGTSLAIEGVVQGIQIGEGERNGFDGGKFGQAAISGAIGGVAGGVVEAGFAAKGIAKGFGEAAGEAVGDGAGAAAGRAAGEAAGETSAKSLGEAVKSAGRATGREAVEGTTEGAVGSAAEQALTGDKPFSWEQVGKGAVSGGVTGSVMGGAVDSAHSLADARSASAAAASASDAANSAGDSAGFVASAAESAAPGTAPPDNGGSELAVDRGDSGRSSIMDALDPSARDGSPGHGETNSSTEGTVEESTDTRPPNAATTPSGTAAQSVAPPIPPAPSTDAPTGGGQPGTTGIPAGREVQPGTAASSGTSPGGGMAAGSPGAPPSAGGNTPGAPEKGMRSPSGGSTPATPGTPGHGPVQGGTPSGGGSPADTGRRPSTPDGSASTRQSPQEPSYVPHRTPTPVTHSLQSTTPGQPGGPHTPTHGDARQQARLAHDAYERIRQDPHDIDDIVDTLALHAPELGFRREDIEDVKKHLFVDPVLVESPSGELVLRSKDPDPYIAQAWDRLRQGTPDETDIGLLRHEQAEIAYLRQHPDEPIHDAHEHANEVYNWESRVAELTRDEIEAIQEITDGRSRLLHEDPRRRPGDPLPLRPEATADGPDHGLRQDDQPTDSGGRPGGSSVPGRSPEDPPNARRAGELAGQRYAHELNLLRHRLETRSAESDSQAGPPVREFVSGGRINDWRNDRARRNEIKEEFYKWQAAKGTADKLAREYIEAKERVRPGIADKRFERFQEVRQKLKDFANSLGIDGRASSPERNWKRFQRLFEDSPRNGTLRVFADETNHLLTDRSPGRVVDGKSSIGGDHSTAVAKRAEEIRQDEYEVYTASYRDPAEAFSEYDRVDDQIIEFMEDHGLGDLGNWLKFAKNFQSPASDPSFVHLMWTATKLYEFSWVELDDTLGIYHPDSGVRPEQSGDAEWKDGLSLRDRASYDRLVRAVDRARNRSADEFRESMSPRQLRKGQSEPYLRSRFAGTSIENAVARDPEVMADPNIQHLGTSRPGQRVGDFEIGDGIIVDITGASDTSIKAHLRRPYIDHRDQIITYRSLTFDELREIFRR